MVSSPWRIDAEGRECVGCGVYQPWCSYSLSAPRQPGGRTSRCKECMKGRNGQRNEEYRAWALKRMGITQEEYDWLLALQGGVCALCKGKETRKGAVFFSVDHDHKCHPRKKTGQTHCCKKCIRGLLCHECNFMIGVAEKKGMAWRFIDYLVSRPFLEREEVTLCQR